MHAVSIQLSQLSGGAGTGDSNHAETLSSVSSDCQLFTYFASYITFSCGKMLKINKSYIYYLSFHMQLVVQILSCQTMYSTTLYIQFMQWKVENYRLCNPQLWSTLPILWRMAFAFQASVFTLNIPLKTCGALNMCKLGFVQNTLAKDAPANRV